MKNQVKKILIASLIGVSFFSARQVQAQDLSEQSKIEFQQEQQKIFIEEKIEINKNELQDNLLHEAFDAKPLEVDCVDDGGTLIFSDSPEYVDRYGILYSDVVEGIARVFYYHLNDMKEPCKIAIVLENMNETNTPAQIEILRAGISQPSEYYAQVGRETQDKYFSKISRKTNQKFILLQKNQPDLLSNEMDEIIVQPEKLFSGMIDFKTNQKIRVSVLAYPIDANPREFIKKAIVLPKDEHRLRGTFQTMNRTLKAKEKFDVALGTRYLVIGDGEQDNFLKGIDATDNSEVTNYGNYGVLYHLFLPMKQRETISVMVNPTGGYYSGVMSATTGTTTGKNHEYRNSEKIYIPANEPFFGQKGKTIPRIAFDKIIHFKQGIEMSKAKKIWGRNIFLSFSPPGAANLPVRLVILPEDTM